MVFNKKEYMKEYRQRPDVKLKRKKYKQRPDVKLKRKKYLLIPEVKKRIKKYYQSEREREKRRKFYKKNKERILKRVLEYQKNPEVKKRRLKYNQTPKRKEWEKIYRESEKSIKRRKFRLLNDINHSIRYRLRTRTRTVIKKYINKGLLPNKVYKQINWQEVCEHLDKTKPDNWQEYHIDHIKPLCSFDLTNSEELKKANHYTNLQWLTPEENISKGGKY